MISITPNQVTPQLASLFDPAAPAGPRCYAVLHGIDPGKIFTDAPDQPRWGAVWEPGDGILYLAGQLDAPTLEALVPMLRRDGEVLVGFWNPGDPIVGLLPPNHDWAGAALDFLDRPADGSGLEAYLGPLPAGYAVREIDQALLERCQWHEDTVRRHGSAQAFLEGGRGFCLVHGDEIVSEAYAGKSIMGVRELGAITQEQHRGRGFATITCAHLVQACEQAGERTYWNCATTNLPSAAVARKLGYRTVREFQWRAWSHLETP